MSRILFECPGKDGETLPWCIGVIGNRTYLVGKGSDELTALGFEFVRDQGLSRHVVDGKVVPVHKSIIGGWYCILKTAATFSLCAKYWKTTSMSAFMTHRLAGRNQRSPPTSKLLIKLLRQLKTKKNA